MSENLIKNQNITYEEWFVDTWDYVSEKVVSDDFWNKNQDIIRAISFDLYRFDKQREDIDIMAAAKRLEIIFSSLTVFKIKH